MSFKIFFKKSPVLVGFIILLFLLKKADISKIILNLESVRYRFLLPLLIFIPAGIVLSAFKWSVLLKKQKIEAPFIKLIKFNLIGQFYGMITPGRLGNLIRINYLKKYTQKSYGQCSASVFLDKLIDFLILLILSFLGILFFIQYLPLKFVYLDIGYLFLLLVVVFFVINQKLNKKWLRFVYYKLVPHKYKEFLKSIYYSFYRDFPSHPIIFLASLLSVLTWIILITTSYFIIQSINVNINWFYFAAALIIASVVSVLPISISGWGTREAGLIVLLSPFSVSLEEILAFSVLNFFLLSVVPGLMGAVWNFFKKV